MKEYKRTHNPMILEIMLNRANSEVSEQIDKEICDLFEGSVSIENALLLGMCSSERSLQLLKQHIQDRDDKIADGVRLAFARRDDKKWEEFYIKEFLLQEER